VRKSLHVLSAAFAMLTLGGCAELDFLQKQADGPDKPPTVSITPAGRNPVRQTNADIQQWCNTLHENKLRARQLYVGKKIAIPAEFGTIRNASIFAEHDYDVSLYATNKTRTRSGDVQILAAAKVNNASDKASNNAALAQFSKGEIVQLAGTVANLTGAGKDCAVHLNNPTFAKLSQTAGITVPQPILQVCESQASGRPLAIDHARLIFKHDEFGALVFSVHQSDIYVPYDIFVHVTYRVSPRTADKVAVAAQKMTQIQTGQNVSISGVITKTARSNIVFQTGTGRFVTNWLTSFTTKTPCIIQMVEKV